ncbi:putative thiamin biosynthesis ApbE [Liquorilactobacillus capillatus DSM 19910]|uniref:FAD:protein FMN transferase n=2 Tax=Liquorilactobacillus capillatus TaxID=480931 RepID=A0A0R1M043_9LACO|nr:putative thiamin biosynthesis ApbE [Liquorilactobacillus capillatus DSM 19910]
MMGTIITLTLEHPKPKPIMAECIRLLHVYEHRFSANDDHSELMQLNHQSGRAPYRIHPEVYKLIKLGKFYSRFPNGNLNIAIGPLVKTWHIGFSDAKVPTAQQIETALSLTDPQNIILDDSNNTVFLRKKGMEIDLGSLAKGFIGDLIIHYLQTQHVEHALLNLGGNVLALGSNTSRNGQPWRIGIQDPAKKLGEYCTIIPAQNQSVVTSGIYQRNLTVGEHFYHHIFNRKTGYPVQTSIASLTIVSDKSVDGEIWTTILFGKPLITIMEAVALLDGIFAIVITCDGQAYDSRVFKRASTS